MRTWAETLTTKDVWWGYGDAPHTAIQACVVLGLEEVKRAGLEAPMLDAARSTLAGMRSATGMYPYSKGCDTYEDDIPFSLGRTLIADWALFRGGALSKDDLSRSLDLYLDHWAEVWGPRGKSNRVEVESDYFLFTRWYAMQIAREIGRLDDGKVCVIRRLLLEHQDADGAWLDSILKTGRPSGTALGILAMLASRH